MIGPADGAAELVLLQAVAHQRGGAAAVEQVVASVFEDVAVERVGSGPRGDGHRGRRMLAGLGAHRTGFHLELLQRVRERKRLVQTVEGIVGGAAIERKRNLVGVASGHGDRDRRKVLVGVQIVGNRALGGGVACEENQLGRLARIQRQFDHFLVADDLTDAGAVGFHRQGLGLDRNLFADRADLQSRVDDGVRIDVEDDARLDVGGEAILGDLHAIGPDREIRQDDTNRRCRCDRGTGLAGVGLEELTCAPGYCRPGGILDGAGNLRSGDGLGPRGTQAPEIAMTKNSNRSHDDRNPFRQEPSNSSAVAAEQGNLACWNDYHPPIGRTRK